MPIVCNIHKKLKNFELNVNLSSNSRRIGILGASGCGKSMTLRSIAGIKIPDDGEIIVDGKTLYHSKEKINQKPQKRNVGYLFQNYALFPNMTVEKNIGIGLRKKEKDKKQVVDAMIKKFQLTGLEKRLPGELSGGQQQRVALARVMAYEPDVILLDEPFSALDMFLKDQLQQEMLEMLADYQGTVILVSHSRDEIYRFSDELLILDQGKTICQGKTKEIFENPQWKTAARLTGCKNLIEAIRIDDHCLEIPGWGMTLKTRKKIPKGINCVGIRAHDFIPIWGQEKENCVRVIKGSMAELPFEKKFFLKSEKNPQEMICWFVQRNFWDIIEEKGLPDYLEIPEEKVLFLQSS